MPEIIHNTPSILIPKELFREEKILDYWSVFYPADQNKTIGKDELKDFFLIYPKTNNEDSIHEISVLYSDFLEKYPNCEDAVCVNVYDNSFCILVVKNREVEYSGFFQFTVKEDVLYHLTHVSQKYFENISTVFFGYQQLSQDILRLLDSFYEMKKI